MRLQRGSRTATIAVLVMFGATTTTVAHAQSTDELKQRIEELERSTREQVDALKRMLQQQEAERAKERRAQEERERTRRTLQEQVEQQQLAGRRPWARRRPPTSRWTSTRRLRGRGKSKRQTTTRGCDGPSGAGPSRTSCSMATS